MGVKGKNKNKKKLRIFYNKQVVLKRWKQLKRLACRGRLGDEQSRLIVTVNVSPDEVG